MLSIIRLVKSKSLLSISSKEDKRNFISSKMPGAFKAIGLALALLALPIAKSQSTNSVTSSNVPRAYAL